MSDLCEAVEVIFLVQSVPPSPSLRTGNKVRKVRLYVLYSDTEALFSDSQAVFSLSD